MARLNEPPGQAESIDALKRRFVRQNREIARANSTQSLRIRNLECETSRLLAENISLREQVIKLQKQFETSGRVTNVFDSVAAIKGKLEDKMKELGGFVAELGEISHVKASNASSPKRAGSTYRSPGRSPDQKNWRNALTLSEVTSGQEGRLPPIVEDKHYPRRTLEAEDFYGLISQSANAADTPSPDMGSPPVAHFESGDPVDLTIRSRSDGSEEEEFSNIDSVLPANLETRKKRRGSLNLTDFRRAQRFESQLSLGQDDPEAPSVKPPEQSLKSGAKRKLCVRDDGEEKPDDIIQTRLEEFKFNRKAATERRAQENKERTVPEQSDDEKTRDLVVPGDRTQERSDNTKSDRAFSDRRILGSKCVNTDPVVSPAKKTLATIHDPVSSPIKNRKNAVREVAINLQNQIAKEGASRDMGRSRKTPASAVKDTAKRKDRSIQRAEIKIGEVYQVPETPSSADLFSPASIEPLTAPAESRDTPVPPDFNPSTSTAEGLDGGMRPARRPRGPVNYAEPNLRDKMRRPTKDLSDAVNADDRCQRANSIKLEGITSESEEGNETTKEKKHPRTVIVKKENVVDCSWKNLPTAPEKPPLHIEASSPLDSKSVAGQEVLSQTVTGRGSGNSTTGAPEKPASASASSSATTISALAAGRRKPKETNRQIRENGALEDVMQKLDIYDFHSSSPPIRDGDEDKEKSQQEQQRRRGHRSSSKEETLSHSRPSRRHSAVLSASSSTGSQGKEDGTIPNRGSVNNNSSTGEGRRLRQSVGDQGISHLVKGIEERSSAERSKNAKSMRSDANLRATGDRSRGSGVVDGGDNVGARAASRRRSMML
ncbi:MAG: hypothetical protein M1837_004805 [Sclerophora amabilis]|nr:MAG: hypothetical protein M1837_004805 [Sclerophora amabilis]